MSALGVYPLLELCNEGEILVARMNGSTIVGSSFCHVTRYNSLHKCTQTWSQLINFI